MITKMYYDLNLINMVCYNSPKTIEFRFLRPTFNFHKILLWLYIFNAVLEYSKNLADSVKGINDVLKKVKAHNPTFERVIYSIYPADLATTIMSDLNRLSIAVTNQSAIGDLIGATTEIEDHLIDPNIVI